MDGNLEISRVGDNLLAQVEERIGHRFSTKSLLEQALTHPSLSLASKHVVPSNQRLEFLGDAVVGLVLASRLFRDLPQAREGDLTRRRAELVREETLAAAAKRLGLWEALRFGELREEERLATQEKALCDLFEALAGAIYLDAGFESARCCVESWLAPFLAESGKTPLARSNPKGSLQEHYQPLLGNQAVSYEVVSIAGPDHRRVFTSRVLIQGIEQGRGTGETKKLAEEAAAREALERLGIGQKRPPAPG